MNRRQLSTAVVLNALLALSAHAQTPAPPPPPVAHSFSEAFRLGHVTYDFRLRHEQVDDDGFARDANATTLRTRLGFMTAPWHGLTAYLEGEDVQAIGGDYNSTANGDTQFPTIADPSGSEWNQAWLAWSGKPSQSITVGRQNIIYDNQRFFGNVGFRQNAQTFDAVSVVEPLGERCVLRYAYLDDVHRVFGNENPNPLLRQQELSAHLLNAAYKSAWGQWVGYGYFVDNQDVPQSSARTLGVRLTGTRAMTAPWSWLYAAEYAQQDDWRDGAATIDADYRLMELGLARGAHQWKIGQEVLGGDGRYGFATPFATLHAFNGWADRFLATPANGLRDVYLSATGKLWNGDYGVVWHDFRADARNTDFGSELDLFYSHTLGHGLTAWVKYADFRGDGPFADVSKLWLALEWKH
jgi:hypothetical protein